MPRSLPAVAFLLVAAPLVLAQSATPPLKTTGEATNFAKTSTSAEVVTFCEQLAKQNPKAKHSTFGTSGEGRPMPLLVLSDPPVATPEDAEKSGKPVVIVTANIHAGEVDGKEAVLALARDLVSDKDSLILKKLVVVIAPNFNPDGNDKFGEWRKTQNGPKEVGTRANAGGFDLNRDFVKLETLETRAVVGLLNTWKPVMVIDCHTTNGSYHRYQITYDGPRMPACDPKLIDFALTKLFPEVEKKVKAATGFDTFTYGDFDKNHEQWLTYGTGPRYGTQLYSLRGSLGILSESYTYSSFEDRVKASYAFVKANCEYVAENPGTVQKLVMDAKKTRTKVALRTKVVAREKPLTVFGYVEEAKDGKIVRTNTPKDYTCRIIDKLEPTLEVDLPAAYLIPAGYAEVANNLRRHGIDVQELREQIDLDVETYTVTGTTLAEREFQKHKTRTVEATAAKGTVRADAGSFLVSTKQDLGQLAAYLLEPMAEDGLTTWNFFDTGIKEKQPFPVRRVTSDRPAFTGALRPLPETVSAKKPFTLDMLGGGRGGASLGGQPMGSITWLEDGLHWLQVKQGRLYKVEARTGKSELFVDVANLRKSLEADGKQLPQELSRSLAVPNYTFNQSRSAVLLSGGESIYVAFRDGSPAKVIATGRGAERPTFSPDGMKVAYTKAGNLFVVDVPTGKVSQLTTDGGKDEILNGRADWVYEEEIFNRNPQAYWWSPDSKSIAFLRFDDAKVPKFTLTNADGKPEAINYPKSGQTNPRVKIGVVSASGEKAEPQFLDFGEYKPDDMVISRVGWVPGSKQAVFAYVQNRTQTWLDFATWATPAGKPTRLFRETTKAWVDDLGEPKFLKDGSFLVLSERTGWKHLYHYSADGQTGVQLTTGKWEVKSIERIDEASGDVYITGTKVSHTGNHLLLANLNGQEVEVLSPTKTTHRIELAPAGSLYVDRESDDNTPTRAILRELRAKPVRILDTNPAYDREKYTFGQYERRTIATADGFALEAAITYPPDFHPLNRYPIWVLTYAGPHAPTVRDGWGTGRVFENVLAAHGVVVLRVDPRSASGKGVESAWTCYKQMGVQELKDLEEAVDWIGKNEWADTTRVGISGHSFGGFITAYALTHSKKFSAGVAGAPVTDWHYYDSIYTERYMGLPAENKEGYEKTSVVKAAKNLHGKLLICHGMIDDNVHPQNSLQFINALQAAGKDFEVMVYPGSRHGIIPAHYPKLQAKFALKALGVEK